MAQSYPLEFSNGNKSAEVIIRFEKSAHQTIEDTTKIVGMVKAKYLIPLITDLDLQANPRNSKIGGVTSAIEDSIMSDPALFPFKTKGILLAASDYEDLDRERVRVIFVDRSIEGILDGGHNTLAIGMYILDQAMVSAGLKHPRGIKTWSDFKQVWDEHLDDIHDYQVSLRKADDGSSEPTGEPDLSFYVPVELLVPSDPDDKLCVEQFRQNLLEICEARNNNAELTAGAKINQKGYFDALRYKLEEKNPVVASRVEWKTNAGGDIKVQDIVALAWLVLRHIPGIVDENGKEVVPPAPVKLYSGKASALSLFERFMSSCDVSESKRGDYKQDLRNNKVNEAFDLVADLPKYADYIYANFPALYNAAGGSYGRINAVKKLNDSRTSKVTPYEGKAIQIMSPDGFIAPLVYGLTTLVDPETMTWAQNPQDFLEENLQSIVADYAQILGPLNWDPQKVGKTAMSYTSVERSYRMALAGIL